MAEKIGPSSIADLLKPMDTCAQDDCYWIAREMARRLKALGERHQPCACLDHPDRCCDGCHDLWPCPDYVILNGVAQEGEADA